MEQKKESKLKPIKDITIKNYQGIEKATISLSDGLNIFLGPTDSGKSSFFRALSGFFYNAVGDFFVQVGEKSTSVEVDGIKWEKGKSVNRYAIGDTVFEKVGRGVVPEEVQQQTGVRDVEFGEDVSRRLNVSSQFGGEFLISDKPSDVAKIIGSLSGVGTVFNALREATADLQKTKKEIGSLEDRQKVAEEKVKNFDYLKKITAFVEKIGENIEKAQEKITVFDNLAQLKAVLHVANQSKNTALDTVAKHKLLAEISFEKYDEIEEQKDYLENLLAAHAEAIEDVEGWKTDVEASKAFTSINLDRYEELEEQHAVINDLSVKQKTCKSTISAAKEIVKRHHVALKSCVEEYEEAVAAFDLCPLTGRELPEECKQALKEI